MASAAGEGDALRTERGRVPRAAGRLTRLGPAGVVLGLVLLSWLVVLAASLAAVALDRPLTLLLDDPSVQLGGPWYAGYLSTFGVVLWLTGGLVAVLGGLVSRALARPEARPLLLGGLLLVWLGLDDAFLVHDFLLPQAGVDERLVFALYVALAAAYALRYRAFLAQRAVLAPLVGAALFAWAVVAEFLEIASWDFGTTAFEDVPKLLGIACFASFFVVRALDAVARALGIPARALLGAPEPRRPDA